MLTLMADNDEDFDKTEMAEDRTVLANECMFAGWMRTSMACVAVALGNCPAPLLLLCILLVAACDRYPRDAHGSLEQILERGTLRIGVIHHPPWARLDDSPPHTATGVEVQLMTEFARDLGVDPVWHSGTESEHFSSLEHYELDVVVGGIDKASPWHQRLGFSLAYYTEQNDVGTTSAKQLLDDLGHVAVSTRIGSGLRKSLENHGAIVQSKSKLSAADAPLAAPTWKLRELNLRPSGTNLPATHRAMAVPPGENALLLRLERHLLRHAGKARVEQLLSEHVGS